MREINDAAGSSRCRRAAPGCSISMDAGKSEDHHFDTGKTARSVDARTEWRPRILSANIQCIVGNIAGPAPEMGKSP